MSDIRWRKKDTEELKRKVKNYNAKIARLMKKNYNQDLLPEKLKYKDLKESIKTRSDFKEQIKLANELTKRGSEETVKSTRGLTLPKFTIKQTKIKIAKINKERKKKKEDLEKIQKTDRNKPIDKTGEKGKDIGVNLIHPKKFNFENMSKKEWEMFIKTVDKQVRKDDEITDARYVKHLFLAIDANLSPNQADKLKELISLIPNNKIVEKYYTDRNMTIDFYYGESDQDDKFKIQYDAWESYAKENGYLKE